jgi:uncharacterized protein (DUF1501 family)
MIPVDDDLYYRLRPTLGIRKEDALPLAGEPLLRLHPMMEGMRRMFDDGRLAIVSNIGYDDYSMSHFTGTEIWNTASGGTGSVLQNSGWLGRYLRREFPEFPSLLPSYPPAVQIGVSTSSTFGIMGSSIGMALADPGTFYALVNGAPRLDDDPAPDTLAGREWEYIRTIDAQTIEFAGAIREAASRARNVVDYPADNPLASSLAIVSQLIAGGLGTSIYMVSMGGFDTHAGQEAVQPVLLAKLSAAIKAFDDDLLALGVDDRVVAMTYSEFGRRAAENDSGTDHGCAAPHIVFGSMIDGGRIFGGVPDLQHLDVHGNLRPSIDFRCYYASVLGPLFSLSQERLREVLPDGECGASPLPLYGVTTSGREQSPDATSSDALLCSPNPAMACTTLHYRLDRPGPVRLTIGAIDGEACLEQIVEERPAGMHTIRIDLSRLPSGFYICRIDDGRHHRSTTLRIIR